MGDRNETTEPPRAGTVQRWAYDYVASDVLAFKLAPGPTPSAMLGDADYPARRISKPGRPPELRVSL